MRYPNFYIVGFPRSGTTSLWNILRKHEYIQGCKYKEPNFLCKDIRSNDLDNWVWIKTEKQYLSYFKNPEKKYWLDASVTYIFSEDAPKLIKQLVDKPKIIIMVRNKEDSMKSFYKRAVVNASENRGFEDAIKNVKHNPLERWKGQTDYKNLFNHKKHIKNYTELFGPNELKIVQFNDYIKDELKVVNEICDWLGIPHFKKLPKHFKEPTVEPGQTKLLRLVLRPYKIKKLLPRELRNKLYPLIIKLFNKR
jgi:hypothetical protein